VDNIWQVIQMSQNAIVDKLRQFFNRERPCVRSEADVVWALVEIRKLIDANTAPDAFVSLKVYCDWTVHTTLTKASRTKEIMAKVDQDFFNNFHPDGHGTPPDEHEKLQALLYLDTFRAELLSFLENNDLPILLASDDGEWFNFLKYYAAVIEDCSLIYKADDLKMVKQLTFRKENNGLDGSQGLPFNLVWDITLKDGREFSWPLTPNWKLLGTFLYDKNEPPRVIAPKPKRQLPWLQNPDSASPKTS
jgi:hypothetical protein